MQENIKKKTEEKIAFVIKLLKHKTVRFVKRILRVVFVLFISSLGLVLISVLCFFVAIFRGVGGYKKLIDKYLNIIDKVGSWLR